MIENWGRGPASSQGLGLQDHEENDKEIEKKRRKHDKHPPFRWVSCRGILRFWEPIMRTRSSKDIIYIYIYYFLIGGRGKGGGVQAGGWGGSPFFI